MGELWFRSITNKAIADISNRLSNDKKNRFEKINSENYKFKPLILMMAVGSRIGGSTFNKCDWGTKSHQGFGVLSPPIVHLIVIYRGIFLTIWASYELNHIRSCRQVRFCRNDRGRRVWKFLWHSLAFHFIVHYFSFLRSYLMFLGLTLYNKIRGHYLTVFCVFLQSLK